jgi:hypothetical protein
MLKFILRAIAAVEMAKDANKDVVKACGRAQLQLLKAATLMVRDDLPKSATNKDLNKLTPEEKKWAGQAYHFDKNSNICFTGKIQAIRRVRERTGCGLVEAKNAVENWMQREFGFTSWPMTKELLPVEKDYAVMGTKEKAANLYRERIGCSIEEATAAIENYMSNLKNY